MQQCNRSGHAHRVFASIGACQHSAVRDLLFRICPRSDPIGIPSGTNFGPIWGSDPKSAAGMTPTKRASDNMMKITCCKPKMWLFPERQCDFQICNCPTWERFEAVIKPQIVKNQLALWHFLKSMRLRHCARHEAPRRPSRSLSGGVIENAKCV